MNYDQHKEVIKGKTLTAYELADAMDTKGFRYREVKAAVVMLRQQADRIAELEKSAEPVAYVNSMCNDCIDWKVEPMSIDGKPLYTTPQTKPLSDEEIETIYYKTLNKIDFARAIEERILKNGCS